MADKLKAMYFVLAIARAVFEFLVTLAELLRETEDE